MTGNWGFSVFLWLGQDVWLLGLMSCSTRVCESIWAKGYKNREAPSHSSAYGRHTKQENRARKMALILETSFEGFCSGAIQYLLCMEKKNLMNQVTGISGLVTAALPNLRF